MIAEDASPERLSEVRRLTEALVNQVLDAQLTNRPVPQEQSTALIKAAFFLRESNLPWWPMLAQAIHGLGRDMEDGSPGGIAEAVEAPVDLDMHGLARFFAGFRKGKDQA